MKHPEATRNYPTERWTTGVECCYNFQRSAFFIEGRVCLTPRRECVGALLRANMKKGRGTTASDLPWLALLLVSNQERSGGSSFRIASTRLRI